MRRKGVNEYFRGWCRFKVTGDFPERFINLCARSEMGLWDIVRRSGDEAAALEANIIAARYRSLLPIARKCGVRLRVREKGGLPFRLLPYRHRVGMLTGFAFFCGIIWILSFFVWTVELPQLSPELNDRFSKAVYDCGVRVGVRRSGIDGKQIASELQLKVSELSWVGVITNGSRVTIDARELDEFDIPPDTDTPCNVVAKMGGVIMDMEGISGHIEVEKGDTVAEGELLVSGVIELSSGGVIISHASGKVLARVERTITSRIPLKQLVPERTGRVINIRRVDLLGMELPLYIGKTPKGSFEREMSNWQLTVGDTKLPLGVRREKWYELAMHEQLITPEEAEAMADNELSAQLAALKYEELISSERTVTADENGVTVSQKLILKENIARHEPILVE